MEGSKDGTEQMSSKFAFQLYILKTRYGRSNR